MDNASDKTNLVKPEADVNLQKEVAKVNKDTAKKEKKKHQGPRIKFKVGLISLIVGVFVLAAGAVILVFNLISEPAVRDADFLVSTGSWEREGAPSVIWTFTEVGKGKLTTNNHLNDYDFIWAIDGDKLKIETSWLYELDNIYTYELNQEEKTLTLSTGEGESLVNINFRPASSVDSEVVQDN